MQIAQVFGFITSNRKNMSKYPVNCSPSRGFKHIV